MLRPKVVPLVLLTCLVALPASLASRSLLAVAAPPDPTPDAFNLTTIVSAVESFFGGLGAPAPGPSLIDELASALDDLGSPAGGPSVFDELNKLLDIADAPGPSPFDDLAAAFSELGSPAGGPSIADQFANLGSKFDSAAAPSACLPEGAKCQYYTDINKVASTSGALSFCCSGNNNDVACFPAGKADTSKGDYPGTCAKATVDNAKALQSALAGVSNNIGVSTG